MNWGAHKCELGGGTCPAGGGSKVWRAWRGHGRETGPGPAPRPLARPPTIGLGVTLRALGAARASQAQARGGGGQTNCLVCPASEVRPLRPFEGGWRHVCTALQPLTLARLQGVTQRACTIIMVQRRHKIRDHQHGEGGGQAGTASGRQPWGRGRGWAGRGCHPVEQTLGADDARRGAQTGGSNSEKRMGMEWIFMWITLSSSCESAKYEVFVFYTVK